MSDPQTSRTTSRSYARQEGKGRSHLLNLNAPQPVRDVEADHRSLTTVQQWVISVIAVTTLLHMAGAAIYGATAMPADRLDGRIGLNLIAAAFGVMAVAAWRGLHGKQVLSLWLAAGLLAGMTGLAITFA